jgi:hypothetical protein
MSLRNFEFQKFPSPAIPPLVFRNDCNGLNFRDKSVPWCGGKKAESRAAAPGIATKRTQSARQAIFY